MLITYLTAIAGMVVISCSWLAVQRLWLRHFSQQCVGDGNDALAGRSGCHNCNCKTDKHSEEGS